MTNELLVGGVPLDLLPDTQVLPTYPVSDLSDPTKVLSDTSPEVSLPDTVRNAQLLGQAAYDSSTSRLPYRSLPDVLLKADGVEIMPRARLLLKGYNGQHQVQLVAGNKRLVEALGEKTLADLNLSRFNHTWTLGNVASRATAGYYGANGWGIELFERGRGVVLDAVPFTECYPTLSARLLFDQLLADAGFTADDWQSPLLDRLAVPCVVPGTQSEAFRDARRLRVGLGPGHQDGSGNAAANRNTVSLLIPFDDFTRPIGNRQPIVPTVPLMYDPADGSWNATEPVYLSATARCNVDLRVSYAKASAQVYLLINGQEVAGGEKIVVTENGVNNSGFNWIAPEASASGLLLHTGDKLQAKVVLRGEGGGLTGTKWGYVLFADIAYVLGGVTVPLPKFEVSIDPELPPGAVVRLQDWLPGSIKQLDLFKCLLQLGGLTVATDAYDNHLRLWPSSAVLDASRAQDWTGKRDLPPGRPLGLPRELTYRLGSFAQRNHFQYTADETVAEGTGDGVLVVDDANLEREADMLMLPFAASERSPLVPALLRIARYQIEETDDPFADPSYQSVTPQPRLVLRSGALLDIVLRGGPDPGPPPANPSPGEQGKYDAALALFNQRQPVSIPVSYFDSEAEEISLDAGRYILPVAWRGLLAQLTDSRVLKERFRLTAVDVANLDPSRPVYCEGLGYLALRAVNEFSPARPTEVELARIHPSFLIAPTADASAGREFYEGEFNTGPTGEFY